MKLGKWPVMAVAAAMLYVGTQHAHPGTAPIATMDVLHGSVHGGTLGCTGLERLWEKAGGRPAAAFLAAEIAMAESSGRQYASLYNTNGTTDRGYWQINSIHGSLSTFGAYANARSAVLISNNGRNWTPWVTYTRGMYVGRC